MRVGCPSRRRNPRRLHGVNDPASAPRSLLFWPHKIWRAKAPAIHKKRNAVGDLPAMKGRNVSVSDLSPRAQRQAAEQLRRGRESQINEAFARQIKEHGPDSLLPADKPKRAKYGNRRTTYKNVYGVERTYDSK